MNPIFLPAPDEAGITLREELFTAQVTGLRQHPKAPQSLQPVTLTSERLSLEQQQQRLCQAAMLEQSWQNTPAARALWHKAHLLSLHLVSSRYQQCSEVQDILRHGVSVSIPEAA
ncbi:hypothetical protein [Xenorhabdus bovienii]|uniref:hypothetical protein n=1 Tax=Xenorhabdus bovienii TaxID=40576 RepID=UPI0023B2D614|nr:hypothetical protein [Xenorhabdus bovienii]MDE9459035.1 hypothetical protein [Xenorhabdus bovienii]MDE9486995.1 hypothetical protein [Xenorhabdus bovienii]MDE9515984.1 hypothetical protein [Xenorhabdus bovienii]